MELKNLIYNQPITKFKAMINSGSSLNKKKTTLLGQFWGSIIWTDILSPIQIFLKLQVKLNTAQYFIRLNVVISLVCETVSCIM